MENLKFQMGQQVSITASAEAGEVIARAEYAKTEPQYLLRYVANGSAVEKWWAESALAEHSPEPFMPQPTPAP